MSITITLSEACFHKDSAIYALLDKANDDDIILSSDADESKSRCTAAMVIGSNLRIIMY